LKRNTGAGPRSGPYQPGYAQEQARARRWSGSRLNRYTDLRALDLADSSNRLGLGDNLFRGVRRFFKCYLGRQGYREGELGVLIALMAGLYPVLSCLKAREIRLQRGRHRPAAELVTLHRPANLEDLFLKLTGRQIREEA